MIHGQYYRTADREEGGVGAERGRGGGREREGSRARERKKERTKNVSLPKAT